MEVAGLAIGAVALIGTFKDCIDFFNMIDTAYSMGKDADLSNTKLDVEKMLFLQWADRVGLVEPTQYDARLADSATQQTVSKVLTSIRNLLSEGTKLRDRYGLEDYENMKHEVRLDRLEEQASSSRMKEFMKRFDRLSIRYDALRNHTKDTQYSAIDKFRWVVRDKEKFNGLIQELAYFNSRLDALVPSQAQPAALKMTEEDLKNLRSIPKLKDIIKATVGRQPEIAATARKVIILLNQNRVLDRLWFRWIDDRRGSIEDRHSRTLEWALDSKDENTGWDNLSQWLRAESGTYWLAGKAGSGKSTLMKYLCGHARTAELLDEWSGGSKLVCTHFFFYALGRAEKKSHEGLLRALLYQILKAERRFIETALPEMWREAIAAEDKEDRELAIPSLSEMQNALLWFGQVAIDLRFFFLIDGLDEFEGKLASVAAFFRQLGRYKNFKMLLSSRPLPAFVAAFGEGPKMHLQDLTRADIATYIDDTIQRHPHMVQLSLLHDQEPEEICRELARKSSGVFLWVVLACRSVLDGFAAFDSITELRARIDELSPELEVLFNQMLSNIDGRWLDHSMRLLHLVFDNQSKAILDPIPTVGLALVDNQGLRADFRGPCIGTLSVEEMDLRCQMFDGRLRSRCAGLLEIERLQPYHSGLCFCDAGWVPSHNTLLDSHVIFMHRSVYEFLCGQSRFQRGYTPTQDGASVFYSHAVLAFLWIQCARLLPWVTSVFLDEMCTTNATANCLYGTTRNACPPRLIVTCLSRLQNLWGDPPHSDFRDQTSEWRVHNTKCEESCRDLSLGLALATEIGLDSVVRFAWTDPVELKGALVPAPVAERQPCTEPGHDGGSYNAFVPGCQHLYQLNRDLPSGRPRVTVFPLLYYATYQPILKRLAPKFYQALGAINSTAMVRYLLERGHDPNEEYVEYVDNGAGSITTLWIRWLRSIDIRGEGNIDRYWLDSSSAVVSDEILKRAEITRLLVDAGAALGETGGEMLELINNSLFYYISGATKRIRDRSMDRRHTSSDHVWVEVRDIINRRLSLKFGPAAVLEFKCP